MFEAAEIGKSFYSLLRELPQNMRHKYLKADVYIRTLNDIDLQAIKKQGITHVFLDMDNTITGHGGTFVDARIAPMLKKMCKEFTVILFSNANEERVATFLKNNPTYKMTQAKKAYGIKKPDSRAFKAVVKNHNATVDTSCMIGDRYLTDVCGAKKARFKLAIKCEPLNPESEPTFISAARKVERAWVHLF